MYIDILINIKKLIIRFLIVIMNYFKCSMENFTNFINWSFTCKHPDQRSVLWVLICTEDLTVCYYHVTYGFKSESTLYSLPECQGTPCLKQAPYLKFKWQKLSVSLNGWVFVYELSCSGFESRCCHLNFRYGTSFEQGVP